MGASIMPGSVRRWWKKRGQKEGNRIRNIITETIKAFKRLPEVREVSYKNEKFAVNVRMPIYKNKLMESLVDIEIKSTRRGFIRGYKFDFDYIPV
jgi:hypothetical protein